MKSVGLFCLFLLLTAILYWPARQAGFTADYEGYMHAYQTHSFWQMIGSKHDLSIGTVQPLTQLVYYLAYSIMGTAAIPWWLFVAALHAFAASLLFRFSRQLAQLFSGSRSPWPAFALSLLFLLHPYDSEALIWKAALQFVLCAIAVFATLHAYLKYLANPGAANLWRVLLLCLSGFFTLEEFLAVPPALLLLGMAAHQFKIKSMVSGWKTLIPPLASLLFIPVYFLLHKLILGRWVGHYGSGVLEQTSLLQCGSHILQHLANIALLLRYQPYHRADYIFQHLSRPPLTPACLLLSGVGMLLFLIFYRRIPGLLRWGGLQLWLALLFLLPVSILYFYYLLFNENDRYEYLPVAFWCAALAGILFFIFKKYAWLLLLPLLVCETCFTYGNVIRWKNSARSYRSLLEDFRWYSNPRVFVLSIPDNYQGTYMFRNVGGASELQDALWVFLHRKCKGTIYEVSQYNQCGLNDGIRATRDSAGLLTVSFRQNGNWFWHDKVGLTSYSTPQYEVQKNEYNIQVHILHPQPGDVLLYPVAGAWMVLGDSLPGGDHP